MNRFPEPDDTPESGDSDGDGPIVLDGDDDDGADETEDD